MRFGCAPGVSHRGQPVDPAGPGQGPGFLDGHGIIDAATLRTMVTEAERSYLNTHTKQADRQPSRYTPSKKLINLVKTGELCCTFPGCNSPVWKAGIDHTTPFDHRNPTRGGQTVLTNLKPLCRFHHRIKTFTSWQDYQDDLGHGWFQSPLAMSSTPPSSPAAPCSPAPSHTATPTTRPSHPRRRPPETDRQTSR